MSKKYKTAQEARIAVAQSVMDTASEVKKIYNTWIEGCSTELELDNMLVHHLTVLALSVNQIDLESDGP